MIGFNRRIKRAILENVSKLKIVIKILCFSRILIGSGSTNYTGWVSTDINILDVTSRHNWEAILPFGKKISAVLMEHVLEHLTEEEVIMGSENIFKHLKKGGYVRIAVPDGYHPNPEYIEKVKPGGTGLGAEDHKTLYNYKTLLDVMKNAGFECNLLEYWDEFGQFHNKEWNPDDGMIMRSLRFDKRNVDGKPVYTSLIIDGYKRS